MHCHVVAVVPFELLKGVEDPLGLGRIQRRLFAWLVGDKERRSTPHELYEVEDNQIDRALFGGIGSCNEVHDCRDIVLPMDASQHS